MYLLHVMYKANKLINFGINEEERKWKARYTQEEF
jgi:hypothetical protein